MQTENDQKQRDIVASLNAKALAELLREHNVVLPRREAELWRPTQRSRGYISGLEFLGSMEVIATNGLMAIYLNAAGAPVFYHKHWFDGEVKPLHSVPKKTKAEGQGPGSPRPTKERSSRVLEKERRMKILLDI